MANIKLADACRLLSQKYGIPVTYQQAYMAAIANIIPAERDNTGRFWLIDESNLPAMAKALGLAGAKKAKPAAKPKPAGKSKSATKTGPTQPARSRAPRLTA